MTSTTRHTENAVRKSLVEWYQLGKVAALIERLPESHHDKKTLRHIITHANPDGCIEAKYQHGHGIGFGRVYAPHSFQKLTTDVRNIVCNDVLIDIDMDNCYPTIALQIFQRNGIDTPILKRYVHQRGEIITNIIETHPPMDRDTIKLSFIVALHNGSYLKHACSSQQQFSSVELHGGSEQSLHFRSCVSTRW